MISRIELHNFMSHSCTVIEPASGLTVLVGPNNCGKSAVVSALQILCQNEMGSYMVRHGEEECKVVVFTDDGHCVEWRRKNSVVSYKIDGEDVHRLQGDIPANLHEILRLGKVETPDGRDFDIHFGIQKSPIFLLNDPGSRAATFFASSSDAAKLVEMQKLHRNKGAQARKDEARLATQVDALHRQLKTLDPVAQIEQECGEASKAYQDIVGLSLRIKKLDQDLENLINKYSEVKVLTGELTILTNLTSPPILEDTFLLEEKISQIAKYSSQVFVETDRLDALKSLSHPPKLADIAELSGITRQMENCRTRSSENEEKLAALADIAVPPHMAVTDSLDRLCTDIDRLMKACANFRSEHCCLRQLVSPPVVGDTFLRRSRKSTHLALFKSYPSSGAIIS